MTEEIEARTRVLKLLHPRDHNSSEGAFFNTETIGHDFKRTRGPASQPHRDG